MAKGHHLLLIILLAVPVMLMAQTPDLTEALTTAEQAQQTKVPTKTSVDNSNTINKSSDSQDKNKKQEKNKKTDNQQETFTPTEEISEDLAVSFPVDI